MLGAPGTARPTPLMSTNTPSGADGPGAPPENPDGEAAEVLDAELVEEPASSPELPALGQVVSPVADEPETLELEPDPTGEVPAIAPSVRASTPAPVRLPPVLPGMPRIAPGPWR